MDLKLQQYKRYYSTIRLMLLLSGIWPKRITRAHQFLAIAFVISCSYTIFGSMTFIFAHISNLGLVTKGLGVAVGVMNVTIKAIFFIYYLRTLGELHVALEAGFKKDLEDPVLRPILLSPLSYFYHPSMALIYWTWILVVLYDSTPMISMFIQLSHNVETIKLRQIYPTKISWYSGNDYKIYLLQYAQELFTSIPTGTVTCGVDALFGFYIFQMAGQFRTLAYRMNNLKSTDDYRTIIKECHERSLMLEDCRNKIQTVYGPIVFYMITTSAMIICANLFQASQIKIYKELKLLAFIVTKLIQALLYGWYGLFLTIESEGFQDSIYNSGWNGCGDKTFLSNILTMLVYKPLYIKACHIFVISLDMFVAITNTAVSYYFMLRTLDEK